jgi:hypothetical protein
VQGCGLYGNAYACMESRMFGAQHGKQEASCGKRGCGTRRSGKGVEESRHGQGRVVVGVY